MNGEEFKIWKTTNPEEWDTIQAEVEAESQALRKCTQSMSAAYGKYYDEKKRRDRCTIALFVSVILALLFAVYWP